MPWSDLVNAMDTACLATLGISVTYTPQNGSGAQQITGIIQTPAMAEDYIAPPPRGGDTITINGTVYDVQEVAADTQGGAVLKLRTT